MRGGSQRPVGTGSSQTSPLVNRSTARAACRMSGRGRARCPHGEPASWLTCPVPPVRAAAGRQPRPGVGQLWRCGEQVGTWLSHLRAMTCGHREGLEPRPRGWPSPWRRQGNTNHRCHRWAGGKTPGGDHGSTPGGRGREGAGGRAVSLLVAQGGAGLPARHGLLPPQRAGARGEAGDGGLRAHLRPDLRRRAAGPVRLLSRNGLFLGPQVRVQR